MGEDRLRPLLDSDDLDATDARLQAAMTAETTDSGRAEVLTQLARVELWRGDSAGALALLTEAEQLGGAAAVVRARISLERGRVARRDGDPDEARRLFEEAVDQALEAGEPFIAADAAHARANTGEMPEWTRRGLELCDRHTDAAYWRGTLLLNLGEWQWEQGEKEAALESFRGAVAAREADGRNPGQLEWARQAVRRALRDLGRSD